MNTPTNDIHIEQQIENSFKDKDLQKQLMHYALFLTKSQEDAKDIVQYALYNVWRSKDTLTDWSNPKAYLIRTIKNQFINNYRKKQKGPTTHIAEDRQRDKTIQDVVYNKAESDFSIKTIQEEINNLSNNLRIALELRMQKHTYEEIAEILHVPVGTIKSRIFIARKELGNALVQKDSGYQPLIKERSSSKPSQPGQDSLQ